MLTTDHSAMTFQRGFSLLEIIITMAILAIGLLGLAGLQARAINAEAESFSRAQAMMLANAMADRMNANLAGIKASTSAATGYNQQSGGVKVVFGAGYNNSSVCSPSPAPAPPMDVVADDLCEWDLALKGTVGDGGAVGGMAEARACVFSTGTNNEFQIDVVWQSRDIGTVPAGNDCGSAAITSRRSGVTRVIRLATLAGT
jgi:type IV pilus assembly protein PilV